MLYCGVAMCPAKVESKGRTFFVPAGDRIQDVREYDTLPQIDRESLSGHLLKGTPEGFDVSHLPCGAQWISDTTLQLPGGTTITRITNKELAGMLAAVS